MRIGLLAGPLERSRVEALRLFHFVLTEQSPGEPLGDRNRNWRGVERDIFGHFTDLGPEFPVRPNVTDNSKFERFLGGDDFSSHEQLVGFGQADLPRKGPQAERFW